MGDTSAVKVAIRVRPFSTRERQEGVVLCVDMQRNMTRLFNKTDGSKKDYFFDYCYWSHDQFVEDPQTGYMSKADAGSRYADQNQVFQDLGVGVLDNAWNGYHTCLFAYGQTGSGKSYSMVGYGSNKGIIPLVCEEIFRRMGMEENPGVKYEVKVSMLEIYNEKVQDLLQPMSSRTKEGLKIREHPSLGVFVDGISKLPVNSYEEISAALELGNQHRTIAATQMNATSSRAHTVLTVSFTQTFVDPGTGQPLNRKQSDINLVDLAGSERAAKTGATGERLQEGSNINLSLSTLGRVITALAKKGSGELSGKDIIPYRDSKLTRILQNALGGNSKTAMIAAISPALFNYDETLSTLRYADQVKSIKNMAIVNETQQEKLIRELREENEKLKAMIGGKVIPGGAGQGTFTDETRGEYEQIIEKLKREKEIAERSFSGKALALSVVHISNLNEDPLLCGNIKHPIKSGRSTVGRRDSPSLPDIIVEGLGVVANHCSFLNENGQISIIPSENAQAKTMLNGKPLTQTHVLQHNDRIRFGNHNYFVFIDPEEVSQPALDWEAAVREANEEGVDMMLGGSSAELQRKEEEMRAKLEQEKAEIARQFQEERAKLESQLKDKTQQDKAAQKLLAQKEAELLARQKLMEEELQRKEKAMRQSDENRQVTERLRRELANCAQKVNEANERALLLGKEVKFLPELYQDTSSGRSLGKGFQNTKVRVKVQYEGLSPDIQIQWEVEKLEERLVDMQELTQQQALGEEFMDLEADPFVDDIEDIVCSFEPHLIGHAYVYLETVYYLLSIEPGFVNIIDDKGGRQGTLKVEVQVKVPGKNLDEFDNLKEFAGSTLQMTINITEAAGLPKDWSSAVFCAYRLPMISQEEFKTEVVHGTDQSMQFGYTRGHEMMITYESADELQSHALAIKVFGDIDEAVKRKELQKVTGKRGLKKPAVELLPSGESDIPAILDDVRSSQASGFSRSQISSSNLNFEEMEALKKQLEERDRLIEQLKREQLRKEQEYNLTLRKYQELERRTDPTLARPVPETRKPVENKKSKACAVF